jgi:hypothetical protein
MIPAQQIPRAITPRFGMTSPIASIGNTTVIMVVVQFGFCCAAVEKKQIPRPINLASE